MAATNTVGRRKTAVARVYLKPGSGSFNINGRPYENYLNNDVLKMIVRRPFELLGLNTDSFDVLVRVAGGGVNGQAESIRLALARALQEMTPEHRPALKREGLLRVDSRKVERKKYGRRKARKRFQFSKR